MTRTARRNRRTLQVAGAGAAALLALSACSSSDDASSTTSDSSASSSGELSGEVTVFAAASLKESFTTLGKEFEKEHPGTKVTFSFGGSDSLAASITGGAPADVFASASPRTMKIVTDAGTPPAHPRPSSATSWRSPHCRATPTRSPPSRTSPSRA
ncbi:extracellular solute-binding protein [Streptomyces sp. MS1.AVA.1]|uniref:Extracellular solute-binding protein n=1 Tax=Streptomyces machairae TaxID=3134109 RepID=A0ABU8UUD5_9ACTN